MSLLTNLIAYYKLDESSGNASDSTANAYTLTNTGIGYGAGKINNGASSGTSNSTNYLRNTSDVGIGGGAITIAGWIKLNGNHVSSDHPNAIGVNSQTNKVFYSVNFAQDNTAVTFSRLREALAWDDVTYTVSPGTSNWNHYALTYDGTNLRGYYNGSLVAGPTAYSGNGSATNSRPNGIHLFDSETLGTQVNLASLQNDEVGIWSRALSSTEITDLYNGGTGLSYPLTVSSNNGAGFFMMM